MHGVDVTVDHVTTTTNQIARNGFSSISQKLKVFGVYKSNINMATLYSLVLLLTLCGTMVTTLLP